VIVLTLTPADVERFWSFVARKGDDDCWLWQKVPSGNGYGTGYGQFRVGGKLVGAHRVSYLIAHGELPQLNVCHSCDTPLCMNPSHLFVGTQAKNIADMTTKERQAKGDKNGSRVHREAMPRGDTHWSRRHPERVARGDRHGSRLHPETQLRGECHHSSKLTDVQRDEILKRYRAGGISQYALAREYGVSQPCISLALAAFRRLAVNSDSKGS
jgi:hypothetical protein